MAALLVFVVFLVAIDASVPIAVSMILGAVAPILTMGSGGTIAQVINNAFSGAKSTPIIAVPLFILGGVIMRRAVSPGSCSISLPILWRASPAASPAPSS